MSEKRTEAQIDERVVITRTMVGIVHMQVCAVADATDDEILSICNRENPAGTSNGWSHVCREDDEYWGKTEPGPCADHSGRVHYLVHC